MFVIASFIGLWCNGNTADFGSVVLGSSPSRPTNKTLYIYRFIGLWCNGNTADFGSVVLGSSPSRPTNIPFSGMFFFALNLNSLTFI